MTKEEQIKGVLQAIKAIIDTVNDVGDQGTPEGPMYAAMMGAGCTLDQFNQLISLAVKSGKITKRGHALYPVKKLNEQMKTENS